MSEYLVEYKAVIKNFNIHWELKCVKMILCVITTLKFKIGCKISNLLHTLFTVNVRKDEIKEMWPGMAHYKKQSDAEATQTPQICAQTFVRRTMEKFASQTLKWTHDDNAFLKFWSPAIFLIESDSIFTFKCYRWLDTRNLTISQWDEMLKKKLPNILFKKVAQNVVTGNSTLKWCFPK